MKNNGGALLNDSSLVKKLQRNGEVMGNSKRFYKSNYESTGFGM